MEFNQFNHFEFVKVGTFHLGKSTYQRRASTWQNPTQVVIKNEKFLNAGTSAYLVCLGNEYRDEHILYAGEYSTTLQTRWLEKYNKQVNEDERWVSWHSDNLDINLNRLLTCLRDGGDLSRIVWKVTGKTEKTRARKRTQLSGCISNMLDEIDTRGATPEISLWVIVNPLVLLPHVGELNISSSIEKYFLLSDLALPFNSRGRGRSPGNALTVEKIVADEK
ncbi:hypothetical protein [Glaciecola sp. KUL10]|uniref:hypothetical protein n=1 Tax=Glaciecola sp. (strain KUL10) TaxID=2161813 RepID=UPI000D781D59|nr:hypothetical protein [Glaciecola sp. KUL10]GBL04792.1 hypothetical protein KUL10_21060 [Glaciecola sp. KUL10]